MNQITTLLLTVLLVMQSSLTSAQTPETKASTPAITRIVFLGDSITAGVGVHDSAKERYSTVTTRLLAGKWEGTEPQWVHVNGINPKGMNVESKIPVVIRTEPIYPAGNYRIAIHDKSGAVVDTIPSNVNWSRMQCFTFDPKDHDGPFRIEIMPEKSAKYSNLLIQPWMIQ